MISDQSRELLGAGAGLLDRALRAIQETLPDTNRALEPVGETAVWVARTSFYERVLTEREGRPTASILL